MDLRGGRKRRRQLPSPPPDPERPQRQDLPTRTAAGLLVLVRAEEENTKKAKQLTINQEIQYAKTSAEKDASIKYYKGEAVKLREEAKRLQESVEKLEGEQAALKKKNEQLQKERDDLAVVAARAAVPAQKLADQRAALNAATATLNAKVKAREERVTEKEKKNEKKNEEKEKILDREEKKMNRRDALLEQRELAVRDIEDEGAAAQKDRDAQVQENGRLVRELATCRAHVSAKEVKVRRLQAYKDGAEILKKANAEVIAKQYNQLHAASQRVLVQKRIGNAIRFEAERLGRKVEESDAELKIARAQLKEAKACLEREQVELEKVIEQLQSRKGLLTTRSEDSSMLSTSTLRYLRNLSRAGVPAAHHLDVFRASEDFFDRKMSAYPSESTSQREANIAQVWELGHSAHLLDVFRLNVKKNGNLLIGRYKLYALSDSTLHYCTAPL